MAATATIDFAALKPEAPALVGVGWISETYGIPQTTIYFAIKTGKIPATAVPGGRGSSSYVIHADDAWDVWGAHFIAQQMKSAKA